MRTEFYLERPNLKALKRGGLYITYRVKHPLAYTYRRYVLIYSVPGGPSNTLKVTYARPRNVIIPHLLTQFTYVWVGPGILRPRGLRDPGEGTKRNGFVPREIQYSGLNLNSPLRHPVCHPRNAYMATTCIDLLGKWKIGVERSAAEWMMYRRGDWIFHVFYVCLFVRLCAWVAKQKQPPYRVEISFGNWGEFFISIMHSGVWERWQLSGGIWGVGGLRWLDQGGWLCSELAL